jgi:hypothetical protein
MVVKDVTCIVTAPVSRDLVWCWLNTKTVQVHVIGYEGSQVVLQMVVRNLMLADWFDEDHSESFLNPKRSKWARELLSNVRQACCVAGQCSIEVCASLLHVAHSRLRSDLPLWPLVHIRLSFSPSCLSMLGAGCAANLGRQCIAPHGKHSMASSRDARRLMRRDAAGKGG